MATQPTLGLGAKFGCAEVCELAGTAATSTPASANPPHEVIHFAETFVIPPAPFSLVRSYTGGWGSNNEAPRSAILVPTARKERAHAPSVASEMAARFGNGRGDDAPARQRSTFRRYRRLYSELLLGRLWLDRFGTELHPAGDRAAAGGAGSRLPIPSERRRRGTKLARRRSHQSDPSALGAGRAEEAQ